MSVALIAGFYLCYRSWLAQYDSSFIKSLYEYNGYYLFTACSLHQRGIVKMHFKKLIAITYALTAAAIAIGISGDFMSSYRDHQLASLSQVVKSEVRPQVTATIVTVIRELPIGHQLTAEDLKQTPWPEDSLPPGTFTSIDKVFQAHKAPRLKSPLSAGEALLIGKVEEQRAPSAMSAAIPPELRAVAIHIDQEHNVNGLVQPRDNVDVLLTASQSADGKPGGHFTSVVVQNALVLAIGQDASFKARRTGPVTSVTVAVKPEDAAKLALAASVGSLSLALKDRLGASIDRVRELKPDDLRPTKATRNLIGPPEIVVFRSTSPTSYRVTASGTVMTRKHAAKPPKAPQKPAAEPNAAKLN